MEPSTPDNLKSVFAGGGLVTLLGALAYAVKLAISSLKAWVGSRRPGVPLADITDASTANTVVVNSLKAVAEENTRINQQLVERDQTIRQLREQLGKYESKG